MKLTDLPLTPERGPDLEVLTAAEQQDEVGQAAVTLYQFATLWESPCLCRPTSASASATTLNSTTTPGTT